MNFLVVLAGVRAVEFVLALLAEVVNGTGHLVNFHLRLAGLLGYYCLIPLPSSGSRGNLSRGDLLVKSTGGW